MMTWHQIAARLLFVGGLAFIWWMFGPKGFAGAGAMILFALFARELELRGRRVATEQEHQPQGRPHVQPHD